jgi:hypothetical protein
MSERDAGSVVEWNLSDSFGGRVTPEELDAGMDAMDWKGFEGKTVRLRGCLPVWAFLKATARLVGTAERIEWVDFAGSAVPIWEKSPKQG